MRKNELKIYLASPRGFCAGVDRAIEIVKKSIDKFGSPVYVRHEIVHNKHVVESLKKIGAIFVEEISEIKDKSRPVIFSAHGVPKKVPKEAEELNMKYVDATCPLVSKVHREAENMYKSGYHIILIGHKGHPEVIGTMGQIPENGITLIETIEDVKKIIFKKDELDTRVKHVFLNDKGKKIFNEIFNLQKKRIYNALLNSSSEEVINFDNVLSKIING